jgi:Family of unknown function (DUF6286)
MSPFRIADRIVAGLVALALLVGGVLVAVEIALQAAGREEPWVLPWDTWYREGLETPWSDPTVRTVCIGLLVAAVLLLLLQFARRRPSALPVRPRADGVHVDLDRRGLEHWLEARLAKVEGVGSVDVRARRRNVRVRADAVARETAPVEHRLDEAATREIGELDLVRPPSVDVHVRPRRAA